MVKAVELSEAHSGNPQTAVKMPAEGPSVSRVAVGGRFWVNSRVHCPQP